MPKKVYFVSLGCPRNLVDSEIMIGNLQKKEGYSLTNAIEKADFIIVNTCGFLKEACEEGYAVLEEVFQNKQAKAKVIAIGCLVQRYQKELKEKFPNLHFLLGSGDLEDIHFALQTKKAGEKVSNLCSYIGSEKERKLTTPSHYAYVKIAEGCKKRCSYCVIPSIKGPLKSKSKEMIKEEVEELLNKGVKELIFIAQDLGDYGKDIGSSLYELLQTVLSIKKDFWLRLLYLYPDEVDDKLIDLIASDKRICSYVDMPLQHINDRILQMMYRKTTKKEIVQTIDALRKKVKDISIRTSLIVGFPDEKEEEFQELLSFLQKYELDQVGIFTFSKEEGTPAYSFENQVKEKIKNERKKILALEQKKIVERKNKTYVGKTLEAIVDGFHPASKMLLQARHKGQAPEIDGIIIINDGRKVDAFGKKYLVQITDVSEYDLIGTVIGECK